MEFSKSQIREFLDELASKKPVPGGGSTSALAGALAAGLVEKVAVLTVGKKKYVEVEDLFQEMGQKAGSLREDLLELVDRDALAYQAVVESKFSQTSMVQAAQVPLETAQKSVLVLEMAQQAAKKGNKNLKSDALCAASLARAAIEGALANVAVNLPYIKDASVVAGLKKKSQEVRKKAQSL